MMTQQHAFVEALIANGVELVTGSPGSEWVAVLDALAAARADNPKAPRYVNCRHETLAVAMAYGYARFTGKVPAVLLHSAVGPLHSAMAIRAAYHGKAPLLLLCGDAVTSDVEGVDASGGGWIWLSRLADHQSSATVAADYVKWNTQATTVPALVDAVSRGCAIARELPQGPTFAGVPCSLLLGEMPVTTAVPTPYHVPPAGAPDLSEIAKLLAGASQPVIITEYAGRTVASVDALIEIAESLGAAVYDGVDPLYVNFPFGHPQYLGLRPDAKLSTADAILCAGVTTPWFPPSAHVTPETRVIMLDDDIDKTRLPYWNYPIQTRVPGDIERNLTALSAAVKQAVSADPQVEARAARRQALAAAHREIVDGWQKEAAAASGDAKLTPVNFITELRDLLPPETLIVDESITHSNLVRRVLGRPGNYVKVGSGGLGIGIGYAIGAKLAQPERPVVFIVGDGTFTYNPVLAGLGACREYDLPMLNIVLDNGGYAAIRGAYQRYRPNGWAVKHGEYPGADFTPQPDYAALAAGFDADGYRVSQPTETAIAVKAALAQLAAGRSSIIDVKLAP
jgi:acetolactate synthase I/II/III large subunit